MSCCTNGLDELFTGEVSRRDADRYRKRGLPRRARLLVDAIAAHTRLYEDSTLEVGVGAGALTVEMLRRGATHAIGIDAVAAQLAAARALAADYDVSDRVEFVLADFATMSTPPAADIVVLDRVVCCYPDWRALIDRAGAQAGRLIALSYPREAWYMRVVRSLMNGWHRLLGKTFRFYVHPVAAMHARLREQHFEPAVAGHYFGWEILIAQRV